jgi:glucose/arabinose dehydrogenase
MTRMRVVVPCALAVAACQSAGSAPTLNFAPVAKQAPAAEPRAFDIDVPDGYRVALVTEQLSSPTGIAFGNEGRIFVIESGGRLVEVTHDGVVPLATGDHAPWTGIAYRDGALYVAEGGAQDGGRIVRFDLPDFKQTVLVEGLPSLGDHQTSGPVVASDGWVYFGQGTATNAGIAGPDQPVDVPCHDVVLAGTNFDGTGAYLPHGTPSEKGQVIKGHLPCSGAIMRVKTSGGPVELVAWGFRNPAGLALDNGALYATDNGYETRGSRPVWGSADVLWKVEMSHWYGWPDYSEGRPLTSAFYAKGDGKPGGFVLADHPERPRQPRAYLPVRSAADGLDFTHGDAFGFPGSAFIALFGDLAPAPVGFEIVRVDPRTGDIVEFARNHGDRNGPASAKNQHGFEHPAAVHFDPSGTSLYVVDYGGRLWKITRETQYANQ